MGSRLLYRQDQKGADGLEEKGIVESQYHFLASFESIRISDSLPGYSNTFAQRSENEIAFFFCFGLRMVCSS